ncbi:hypothetical protein MASR2M15_05280 [Anaerolineales bacterium]
MPAEGETSYSPEDEIDVLNVPAEDEGIKPEDMIAAILRQQSSEPAGASDQEQPEEPISPEDMLFNMKHDDDDFVGLGELQALQLMAEDADPTHILDDSKLSPAERLIYQTAREAEVSGDSGAYARMMLEQLDREASDGEVSAEASAMVPTEDSGAEDSAAEYARRELAKLKEADATPIALSPEQEALAAKFKETEKQIAALREQYEAGYITREDLQQQLQSHMILDQNEVWWMMGFESSTWYRFENGEWVPAEPPFKDVKPAPAKGVMTETGTLDPDEVILGSLPYFPDAVVDQEQSEYSQGWGSTGYSSAAPSEDLGRTMVGNAAFEHTLPSAAPTVVNQEPVNLEQTLYAPPVQVGVGVQSPIDDGPPDYNIHQDAPLVEQYQQAERSRTIQMFIIGALAFFACFAVFAVIGAFAAMSWYNSIIEPYLDDIAALATYNPTYKTARIMDANGQMIAELNSASGGVREPVPLEAISPFTIHAVISSEDPHFYDKGGFDFFVILGTWIESLVSNQISDPTDSITQQVTRNFVTGDQSDSLENQIRTSLVSMELSNTYDKNFILNFYINESNFGNQSFGAEAATDFYFEEKAIEADMAEGALLAALLPAPATNDPVVNREQAIFSMRSVLAQMIDVGCLNFEHGIWAQTGEPFCVTPNTRVPYQGQEVPLYTIGNNGSYGGVLALWLAEAETGEYKPRASEIEYPHFVNYVFGQIEQIYGPGAAFQRGFTIYTTLDPTIQDEAEKALREQVKAYGSANVNTGAVVVTDPKTGALRALVGSPNFNDVENGGQVDYSRTWQLPAQAIHPIVYAAALEASPQGYKTPASILWDVESTYNINGQIFKPTDIDGRYRGPISLRFALQNIRDVAAVKAYEFVGNDRFINTAVNMGLQYLPDSEFSLPSAMGTNPIRLMDLVRTYGTMANGGFNVPIVAITRITEKSGGTDVDVAIPTVADPEIVMSPQTAYLMQNIMSDDNSRAATFGLNSALTLANVGVPSQDHVAAISSTGLAPQYNNAPIALWTVGYTPNAVVGVWMGSYDTTPLANNTSGFLVSAPVWNKVMRQATAAGVPGFPRPAGIAAVNVCASTGTMDFNACPRRTTDIAIQSQLPPDITSLNGTVVVNTWTGAIANEWCPEHQEQRNFTFISDPFAVNWINNTGEGRAYAASVGLAVPVATPPTTACYQGMPLPTVRLLAPSEGQSLKGDFDIQAQISTNELSFYEILLARLDRPDTFETLATNLTQQTPNGGVIYSWNTNDHPNGTYLLRLRAVSTSGGYVNQDVQITLVNDTPTPTATMTMEPFTPLPLMNDTPAVIVPPVITAPGQVVTIAPTTQPFSPGSSPIPFDPLNPSPTATIAP